MSETLKFPTGVFSHTEFAVLNGKTNQQVWTRYSAARESGEIVPATPPTRKKSGKGKPELVWVLNPNYVAPVVSVNTTAPVVKVKKAIKPEVKAHVEAEVKRLANQTPDVVEVVRIEPAVAPVVQVPTPAPVMNIEVKESTPATEPVVVKQVEGAQVMKEKCPVCSSNLFSVNDATGVMVWCGQPTEICNVSESPSGHGKRASDAYETLMEKWTPLLTKK